MTQSSQVPSGLELTSQFKRALDLLHDGSNLYLTGKAGTGKSTLIRLFTEQTDRSMIVAAPTGIAALNVDGYTIHRLFSFHPSTTLDMVQGGAYYPGRFAGVLRKLEVLIIDEVSMVRADLFDMMAAALERFGPKPGQPFGGVQVILVGDLYQLAPVVTESEAPRLLDAYETPFFFSANNYEPANFPVVELTKVFRQAGDAQLISILNSVREGLLQEDAREFLNTHHDVDFEPPIDEFWLTLTTTNRIAEARNRRSLEQLPSELFVSRAVAEGELLESEPPVPLELNLKIGAQVMMLNNDSLNRWVNGTICEITDYRQEDDAVHVEVMLTHGEKHWVEPHLWEITQPSESGSGIGTEVIGTIRQLPLKLAWAITIHKAQGQTLEKVHLDLSGGTFADGQLYVALSRCTSLEGLVLRRQIEPRDLKVDNRVRRFMLTGGAQTQNRGAVYLAANLVGDNGRMWRKRPIELAAVSFDGFELTTLIDPTRDLGEARQEIGIGAEDVQLAPTLEKAWPLFAEAFAGYVPVAKNVDELQGYLDYELKRQHVVAQLPMGIEAPSSFDPSAAGQSALDQARALKVASERAKIKVDGHEAILPIPTNNAYLLPGRTTPVTFQLPSTSQDQDLGPLLSAAVASHSLTPTNLAIVQELETSLGVSILDSQAATASAQSINDVLAPGARVCFTGSAVDQNNKTLLRSDLEMMAESRGLEPVKNVTKTKCEALISAEEGSLSTKARNAAKWGKPVFTVAEFLAWTTGKTLATEDGQPSAKVTVKVEKLDRSEPKPVSRTRRKHQSPRRGVHNPTPAPSVPSAAVPIEAASQPQRTQVPPRTSLHPPTFQHQSSGSAYVPQVHGSHSMTPQTTPQVSKKSQLPEHVRLENKKFTRAMLWTFLVLFGGGLAVLVLGLAFPAVGAVGLLLMMLGLLFLPVWLVVALVRKGRQRTFREHSNN